MDEGSDEKYIVWLDSDEMLYTRSWKMEMEGDRECGRGGKGALS